MDFFEILILMLNIFFYTAQVIVFLVFLFIILTPVWITILVYKLIMKHKRKRRMLHEETELIPPDNFDEIYEEMQREIKEYIG